MENVAFGILFKYFIYCILVVVINKTWMNFSLLLFSVRRFTNMHSLRESQVSTPNRVIAFQELCSMRICGLKAIKDFLCSSWYLVYFLGQLISRQIASWQMRFARLSSNFYTLHWEPWCPCFRYWCRLVLLFAFMCTWWRCFCFLVLSCIFLSFQVSRD